MGAFVVTAVALLREVLCLALVALLDLVGSKVPLDLLVADPHLPVVEVVLRSVAWPLGGFVEVRLNWSWVGERHRRVGDLLGARIGQVVPFCSPAPPGLLVPAVLHFLLPPLVPVVVLRLRLPLTVPAVLPLRYSQLAAVGPV